MSDVAMNAAKLTLDQAIAMVEMTEIPWPDDIESRMAMRRYRRSLIFNLKSMPIYLDSENDDL